MSKAFGEFVATFVSPLRFEAALARAALESVGLRDARLAWLKQGVALDAFFPNGSNGANDAAELSERLRLALSDRKIDVIVQAAAKRRKSLLVADMDSTMIEQECLDQIADAIGVRSRVAAITEAAMRGEIDFAEALAARVALFAGLRYERLEQIAKTRMTASPGAARLVGEMRRAGAYTALLSGGFPPFTIRAAQMLGFDEHRGNRLAVENGVLTGRVETPVFGAAEKAQALEALRLERGLSRIETLAVGDGANDAPMAQAAGLGVAYRGKPALAARAHARLDHADLTALLYAQGYAGFDGD